MDGPQPRDPAAFESQVGAIWARTLGLDRVGPRDSFFALGGHSLLAVQLLSRLRLSFGVDLPLARVFELPTVAELARELGIDTGSTTRTLDRLEDKGFVQRTRSAEDRRVVKLELTPAGRQVAGLVPDVISEVLNLHLIGFSKAEHDQLRDFLQRMMANGERMEAAQAAGAAPQA